MEIIVITITIIVVVFVVITIIITNSYGIRSIRRSSSFHLCFSIPDHGVHSEHTGQPIMGDVLLPFLQLVSSVSIRTGCLTLQVCLLWMENRG
jgi:high-affinity Fe2+/Pb2+ permease